MPGLYYIEDAVYLISLITPHEVRAITILQRGNLRLGAFPEFTGGMVEL